MTEQAEWKKMNPPSGAEECRDNGCWEYRTDGAVVSVRHTPHGPSADATVTPIRSYERDPSTASWRNTMSQSTSARLLQLQRDLAASQEDLTRAEQDRAEAIEQRDEARAEAKANAADADRYLAELQQTAVELMRTKAEVRRLEAELGAALGSLNEQTHGEPS